jgi:hypothetical protein
VWKTEKKLLTAVQNEKLQENKPPISSNLTKKKMKINYG